jgi:type III pantothenate kinase
MHLAIDIGNTTLKFALYDAEKMSLRGSGMEELAAALDHNPISRAILTAVSDSGAAEELLRAAGVPYVILSHHTALPITNLYTTPETLGTDRICLAVAADRIYAGAPSLVIAAGTCVTYNFS